MLEKSAGFYIKTYKCYSQHISHRLESMQLESCYSNLFFLLLFLQIVFEHSSASFQNGLSFWIIFFLHSPSASEMPFLSSSLSYFLSDNC